LLAAPEPLAQAVAALEARLIGQALAATGGNKLAAARRLGIARATLYQKLAAYPELAAALAVPPAPDAADVPAASLGAPR
jgi:DNA-binding NtrC family response regulator